MPMLKSFAACAAVAIGVSTPHAFAQTAMPTAREVPARLLPVPTTVSPQMQKIIGAPISPTWKDFPRPRTGRRRSMPLPQHPPAPSRPCEKRSPSSSSL